MKNRIMPLLFAGAAALALCLSGCETKSFRAEKEMWRANKLAQAVFSNPQGTPPAQRNRVQKAYEEIIRRYPDSLFAVQSRFAIGNLYLLTGEYERARQEYSKLVTDCDKKAGVCAEASWAVGQTYQAQDDWAQARAQYKKIVDQYPFSPRALEVPIYFIAYYRQKGSPQELSASVDEAVSFYTGLKSRIQNQQGRYFLQTKVTQSYMVAELWQDALSSLDKLIRDYPTFAPEQALWLKAVIYRQKLQDLPRAQETLERIQKEYPDSVIAKKTQSLLKKN